MKSVRKSTAKWRHFLRHFFRRLLLCVTIHLEDFIILSNFAISFIIMQKILRKRLIFARQKLQFSFNQLLSLFFNVNSCIIQKYCSFAGPSSASLTAFDDILNGPFKTYLDLSKRIGSEVATIGEMVEAAFKAHRAYLEMATKAKQPSQVNWNMSVNFGWRTFRRRTF